MAAFFRHDSTGRIVATGNAPASMIPMQTTLDATAVEGVAIEATQYFDLITESLAARPANNYVIDTTAVAAYDVGIATITGVPAGAKISIGPTEAIADGTPIEITFYEPGEYRVVVEAFPVLPLEVTINAT